jgi:hypothetical protein
MPDFRHGLHALHDVTYGTCKSKLRREICLKISSLFLDVGRPRVRFPMCSLGFFNIPNPSSRNMALESTQLLTEMSLPGG